MEKDIISTLTRLIVFSICITTIIFLTACSTTSANIQISISDTESVTIPAPIYDSRINTFLTFGEREGFELFSVVDSDGTRIYNLDDFRSYNNFLIPHMITAVNNIAIFGRDGSRYYDYNFAKASVQMTSNTVNYIFEDGTIIFNIAGLMADIPETTLTQAFDDADNALQNDERVMMIMLDGWGWYTFLYHQEYTPFLLSLNPQQAIAVHPPISPTGLASFLTGKLSNEHGIRDRRTRMLETPDIFMVARELNKSFAYIKGSVNMFQASHFPILSPDINGINGTDDEVFENALNNLDVDLLVIHFKGIDDTSHTYGPFSPQVGERLALLDGFIYELVNHWNGRIIITSDHGQHELYGRTDRLGDHLFIHHLDMMIPYILYRRH